MGLRTRQVPRPHLEQRPQHSKPAKPLVPRNSGIRWRRGREHEELRLIQSPVQRAVVAALTKHALIRRLSYECDDLRPEVGRDGLDAITRPREVRRPQVARSARRSASGVRQTNPVLRKLSKLLWLELARREPGGVEQSP